MSDTDVISALSALVVQILEANQGTVFAVPVAPLTSGRILLGRQWLKERSSPSRVVFIPMKSRFGPPATKSNTVTGADGVTLQGRQNRLLARPFATDVAEYEIHCWAQSNPADPERDFDATRYLAHVVIQAMYLLTNSSLSIGEGIWSDQQAGTDQIVKAGHEFVFTASVHMPVTDSSVQQIPAGTKLVPTLTISQPG